MKINKLFHWLYAILMLLPIFAIGVTCGYVMFNDNAYQSYYGNTINEYNDVVPNDFKNGQLYNISIQTDELVTNTISITLDGNISNLSYPNLSSTNKQNIENNCVVIKFINNNVLNMYISFRDTNDSTIANVNIKDNSVSFNFISSSYQGSVIQLLPYLTCRVYTSESFLSEVFYYSVDKVSNSPFFAWANSSFLVAPFQYIFNLFGISSNNPLMLLLSYWLSVSIIWLVFDLIMYVPLLAHRWIDKGMVD